MNVYLKAVAGVCLLICAAHAADTKDTAVDKTQKTSKKNVQQIIFEEQKIEGKIRRPQMVLIKADQRPNFSSMVLASLGKNDNIADFVDQSIIDKAPNQEAFQFDGTRISNIVK
jgi:hypothetical protein